MVNIDRIRQHDIYLVNFNRGVGHEMRKIRPAIIISPKEINDHLQTVIVCPLTRTNKAYPFRVTITLRGENSWAALDQIRTIDKSRLIKYIDKTNYKTIQKIKGIIHEMLIA